LVLRIEAFFDEVIGPLGEHRPIGFGEFGIALLVGQRGEHDEHVAAFLHRHAVAIAAIHAIHLPAGMGIGAEVMRRIAVRPARRGGVIEHGNEHGLDQRRAENQEERCLRKQHIHRADATVGKIFLREHQRLAVGVGTDLVAGKCLAVGQGAELGIFVAGLG